MREKDFAGRTRRKAGRGALALGAAALLHLLPVGRALAQEFPDPLFLGPSSTAEATGWSHPAAPFARTRLVRLNPNFAWTNMHLAPGGPPLRLLLNLFSNEQHMAVFNRSEIPGPRRKVFRGQVEGRADSQVILAICQGVVAGSVFVPGRGSFQIQHAGGGWQRVAQLDGDQSPPCGNHDEADEHSNFARFSLINGESKPSPDQAIFQPSASSLQPTNSILDLLVVYTSAARDGAGGTNGMQALIDVAVAEANNALENSQVTARLQLVHQAEVDYQETGDINQDLDNLEEDDEEGAGDDGPITGVHELRRQFRADLVCLITETTGGPYGLANVMRDVDLNFSDKAFSVVQRQFLNTYYVLAHEVGHNLGCQHPRGPGTGDGAFEFSHAQLFVVGGMHYHTIMAYSPGLPTPYFSNPDVSFLGVPTGVPEGATNSANNAKTISLTAPTVALFSTVLRTGTPPQVTLVAPTNGATFIVPAAIELSATATDDDGQVSEVKFYVDEVRVGEIHDPPFTMIWTNMTPGTYSIRAVAKDNVGWETTSPEVTVTLALPPPYLDLAGTHGMPDGSFQVRARGVVGQGFRIDSSQNLTSWTLLLTNSFATDWFDALDAEATNFPMRFYRVLPAP